MRREEILIVVFSYNMGRTLANCLDSVARQCPGVAVALWDDHSDDPETLATIESYRSSLDHVVVNLAPKEGRRHGNLYRNIQASYEYAIEAGYKYLLMVQDDMQVVRLLDDALLSDYGALYFSHPNIVQIDPRFTWKRTKRNWAFLFAPDIPGYVHSRATSYADVGFLHLDRLRARGWVFRDSELENQAALAELGLRKVTPFRPCMMYVPFPRVYRRGVEMHVWYLPRRGSYSFHDMTPRDVARMDARPPEVLPYFRRYLKPKGLGLARLIYAFLGDKRVFG